MNIEMSYIVAFYKNILNELMYETGEYMIRINIADAKQDIFDKIDDKF